MALTTRDIQSVIAIYLMIAIGISLFQEYQKVNAENIPTKDEETEPSKP